TVRGRVIRLLHARGREEEALAVPGPGGVVLIERAGGHLPGRGRDAFFGDLDRPEMRRPRGIEVAGTVEAIDGPRDHAHIALVLLGLLVGVLPAFRRVVLLRLLLLLLLRLLGHVLVVGRAREGDRLAVRRPHAGAGALRQVRERAGFTAGRRHHPGLRRLPLAVLLDHAVEGEARAVRRPARVQVLPARERARRRAAVRRHDPDRGVVAFLLLVDRHADEGDALAVGG